MTKAKELARPGESGVNETAQPVLEVSAVDKRFGGMKALDRVNLVVPAAEIKGLIGPNGAGKTTLINVITRFTHTDAGRIAFLGQNITPYPAHRLARLGIGRTFQISQTAGALTVRDLVKVGLHPLSKSGMWEGICRTPWERREEAWIAERAEAALHFMGLGHLSDATANTLSCGDRKLVELTKAVAGEPKLLLLDEPAAGLSPVEVERLALMLGRLKERGVTMLLVEHNVPLVMDLADSVCVLDFGQVIADGAPDAVLQNPAVVKAYLGEE